MDILLNELSLSGQYDSREIFVEEILPTLIGVLDEIQELFKATFYKNQQFYSSKVHIKYEKRRNEAIKLSIKDLKGLWKAA